MSSNINRDYLLKLNVKTGTYQAPTIYFYNTDISTSNIYVQLIVHETLLDVTPIEQAENYKIKVNIIKPNNMIKVVNGELVNAVDSIFEFNLPSDCTNLSGTYYLEFMVTCNVNNREERTTSFPGKYEVRKSILTGLISEIEDSEDNTTILDIISKLSNKFDDVRINKEQSNRDKTILEFCSEGAVIKTVDLESTSSEIIKVNTIEERDNIDVNNLRHGDFCYVINDENEIYIYYYSVNGWASIKTVIKHPVEIGDTPPSNKDALWIDTSTVTSDPSVSDSNISPTMKYLMNKISELMLEIKILNNELDVIKKQLEGGIINPDDNIYFATEEGDIFITEDNVFIIPENAKSDEPTNGVMLVSESGESFITEDGKYIIQEG